MIAGDRALYVTNAKGLGAGPNDGPGRPNPYTTGQAPNQYVGSMMVGTLSTVKVPAAPGQLQSWSAQVARHDGFDTHGDIRSHQPAGGPVPRNPQQRSPIQHVIYVVKENRTYDQEFGSLGKGNGDPALNLFGEESAPNNRALERGFVTLDNFYADAEVSAQGWNWTVAANSNPYAEQTWASNYSNRGAPYPSENGDPAIAGNRDPSQAHIWDRLAAAHIPFRNYGFYLGETPGTASRADDPVLDANTDHDYRGFNLACPDTAATFTPRDPGCGPARPASTSGNASSPATSPAVTCPPSSRSASPTTTPPRPNPEAPPPAPTSPTTTGPWANSSTPCPTRPTGPPPRSSSPRTTPRTDPTTSTPTAPSPKSSAPTPTPGASTPPSTAPPRCCGPWNSSSGYAP